MLSEYSFSLGIQFLFRLHTGNSDKQLKKKSTISARRGNNILSHSFPVQIQLRLLNAKFYVNI